MWQNSTFASIDSTIWHSVGMIYWSTIWWVLSSNWTITTQIRTWPITKRWLFEHKRMIMNISTCLAYHWGQCHCYVRQGQVNEPTKHLIWCHQSSVNFIQTVSGWDKKNLVRLNVWLTKIYIQTENLGKRVFSSCCHRFGFDRKSASSW